jgi:protein SCO1/2
VSAVAKGLLAAITAALLLALAGCGGSGDQGPAIQGLTVSDHDGYRGIKLDKPYAVPDVPLTDTSDHAFDLARQDKRTLVFFGYTNCPDICQTVMSTIASAVVRLSKADQAKLQVAFVTTDPARDTRSVLRKYLDRFDPRFVGLTGPLSQINRLGHPMDIEVLKGQKLPDGGYEVQHTTNVIAVHDAKGDLVWTAGTSPQDLAVDLRKLLKADS